MISHDHCGQSQSPSSAQAQWSGILLLHQWCARSVAHHRRSLAGSGALCCEGVGHHALPWRYQLAGAGLCLRILTTVGLVAV